MKAETERKCTKRRDTLARQRTAAVSARVAGAHVPQQRVAPLLGPRGGTRGNDTAAIGNQSRALL